MAIKGPVVPRPYGDLTSGSVDIAPTPVWGSIAPNLDAEFSASFAAGEVFTCARTGRMWILGYDAGNNLKVHPVGSGEIKTFVHNGTGSLLTKGQVVYITGSNGTDKLTVALADADTEATSSKTIGLVWENITNGQDGFVMTEGLLLGVKTNSIGNAGDGLWLSSTAGTLTTTRPSSPAHATFVGWIVKSAGIGAGSIYVKVQNYPELEELSDVLFTSPANNDTIAYDSSTGIWKNKPVEPNPSKRSVIESELNATGNLTSTSSGTGASATYGSQGGTYFQSIATQTTGSQSTGRNCLGSAGTSQVIFGSGAMRFTAIVQVSQLSTVGEAFTYDCGFIDNLSGASVDGAWFSYTNTVASGNWTANVYSNSVTAASPIDTGIAVSTSSWYRLEIVVNAAASEIKFYINNSLVATVASSIPSGSTRATGFGSNIRKSNGVNAVTVKTDYVGVLHEVIR